ncbi:MAG: hypothetical protein KDB65_11535 [Calditrichaeota bacterium]|nr:hypothetical protein [Calditrichota bacterium]MCB9367860.1 hypothetical protein [Calditrichota bacterium]
MPSYIIHSGWWCDETRRHIGANYNESDDRVRTPGFFDVWYECVKTFADPVQIFVADSASPLKPDLSNKQVEWVNLAKNFKHGMICEGKYGGWTRSFSLGAMHAYLNDADYSVFLEQDCLIVGEGIIEDCIAKMGNAKIMYGATSPVRIEQSFVVIRRDYILDFLHGFLGMKQSDKDLFTEVKFQRLQKRARALRAVGLPAAGFEPLPFGFGRNRPLDLSEPKFYAQQWSREELESLNKRVKFESLTRLLNATA